jgi:hypothetical protein
VVYSSCGTSSCGSRVVYYSNGSYGYVTSCGSCASATPSKTYESQPKAEDKAASDKPAEAAEKIPAPDTKTEEKKAETGKDV